MAKSLEETVAKENVCKQSVVREAENYFRGLEKRKKSLAQGLVCVPCWLRVKCPPHNQNQELFVLLRETSNKSVKSYKHTVLAQDQGTGHLSLTLSTILLSLGLSRAGYFICPRSFTYKRKFFKRNKEICSYIFLIIFKFHFIFEHGCKLHSMRNVTSQNHR